MKYKEYFDNSKLFIRNNKQTHIIKMGKYIKEFAQHSEYNAYINSNDKILPNVSYCVNANEVHYNPWTWAEEYLTTVALETGTISFNIFSELGTDRITSISYSTDNGTTWTTTANQDDKEENLVIEVNVNAGDKVLWKGLATTLADYDNDWCSSFRSTCEFDAKGNIMSLLYGDDFKGQTTIEEDVSFYMLFGYDFIDGDCMLVNASDLILPATTLASNCYDNMFSGCSSLTTAPELPATTLAQGCYSTMFSGCSSLTTAPELPATTLAQGCYSVMFQGCSNLNYIKAMFTTTPTSLYTSDWVDGVAASGTFVKNSSASWNVTGVNGVPSGWTVQTASN